MGAYANLANHPLLQSKKIIKVINEFEMSKDDYILSPVIPVRTVDQSKIVVDVKKGFGGMTQAAVAGAESPTVAFGGVSQFEFAPASWREKVILSPNEISKLRKLGTAEEVASAAEIVSETLMKLRTRVENRMEWLRWRALYGSLSYVANDIEYSVDYKVPADMRPALTGTDMWTNSASDPMDDLLEWMEIYRDLPAIPSGVWFNSKTHRTIMQNTKMRTLRDTLMSGQPNLGNLTPGNLQAIFNHYAGVQYNVYDGGHLENVDITAAVASSGTTIYLRSVDGLAAGDSATIIHRDGDIVARERVTVESVNASTKAVTISSPGIVYSSGYPKGSTFRVKKHFITDGSFIIRGQMPSSTEGGPQWAEIISTTHEYGPDPMTPASGIFAKVNIHELSDPPKAEVIAGFNGLPVVYHRDVNVIADVF